MNFCLIRLGKDSIKEIELIDSHAGAQVNPLNITITCKQVPFEVDNESFAFFWLGSDNNKGIATKWEQGLRAFGKIESKEGGPLYSDEWVLNANIYYVLSKSVKAIDIIEKAGSNYIKISNVPIIGLNTHSNQTVQLIKTNEENQQISTFFDLLGLIDPMFITNVYDRFPNLIQPSTVAVNNTWQESPEDFSPVVDDLRESIMQLDEKLNETNQTVEDEDTGSGMLMQEPFDPKLIDIKQKNLSIDLLIKRLAAIPSEIDLYPDFQRKDDLWDDQKQSQLIESILISFPLPAFYFDGTNDDKWLVVDGLQRLSALRNFMVNKKLKLIGLEFLHQLNGKTFNELPRTLQRQIEEAQIVAYVINPGTPDEVKFNIFKRINTGGLVLESQEIRHAINQGVPAKFIAELSDTTEFKDATEGKIKTDRMLDREFVTRFVTFYIKPFQEYKPDLDSYMNQRMAELKIQTDRQLNKMKYDFIESMKAAKLVFGKWAFRKVYSINERLKPINKALFEVWSVSLAKLSDEERVSLIRKKDILFQQFIDLMNSESRFVDSITSTTGDKTRVGYRFTTIEHLIIKVLQS